MIGMLIYIGMSLWANTYDDLAIPTGIGTSYSVYISPFLQTQDGQLLIGAMTDPGAIGAGDVYILRLDPSGNPTLVERLLSGDFFSTHLTWCLETSDGGYLFGGVADQALQGRGDVAVIKMSSSGSVLWAKRIGYSTAGYEHSFYAVPDATGNAYVIVGYLTMPAAYSEILVLKVNNWGSVERAVHYPNLLSYEYGYCMVKSPDGDYVIMGLRDYGKGARETIMVKLDDVNLTPLDARKYSPVVWVSYQIVQAADEGYFVVGRTSQEKGILIKLSERGDVEWGVQIPELYFLTGVAPKPDGGCIAVGHGLTGSVWSLFILNFDHMGNLLKGRQYTYLYGSVVGEGARIIRLREGGYAVITTVGVPGSPDSRYRVLVLTLDETGDYPECLTDFNPTLVSLTITALGDEPSVIDMNPPVENLYFTMPSTSLSIESLCEPVGDTERTSHSYGILYAHPVHGALIFNSPYETHLKVFSADGQLVYSRELRRGETRVELLPGVYFWEAKPYKGKAVVR